jgi:hypothetical protein
MPRFREGASELLSAVDKGQIRGRIIGDVFSPIKIDAGSKTLM